METTAKARAGLAADAAADARWDGALHRRVPLADLAGGVGGSVLYLLSACSLLYGLVRVIGPVLETSFDPMRLFPSLGALYVYEVFLLGAALLIVLWRNVLDDAAWLVVLAAVFLGIGGIALETVANDSHAGALGFAVVLSVLAAGKLWALRRWLAPGLRGALLAVTAVLAVYGYAAPVVFGRLAAAEMAPVGMRTAWLAGWGVLLGAGAVLVVVADRIAFGAAWQRAAGRTRSPGGVERAADDAATTVDGVATTADGAATVFEGAATAVDGPATGVDGAATGVDGPATGVDGTATVGADGAATVDGRGVDGPTPFLRTRGMGWVFVTVLLATAAAHQFALLRVLGAGGGTVADAAGFGWGWTDALPFGSLAVILVLRLRHVFGQAWGRWDDVLAFAPAFAIAVGLRQHAFGGALGMDGALLWHPSVVAALTGLAVGVAAHRTGRSAPWTAAMLYATLAVLTLNLPAGGGTRELLWLPAGGVLVTGFVLAAVLTRRVGWAVAAAAVVGAGLLTSPAVAIFAREHGLRPLALVALGQALALWAVHLAFPAAMPRRLAQAAPLLLLLGTMGLFREAAPLLEAAAGTAPALFMGAATWWRTRSAAAGGLYAGAPGWQAWRVAEADIGWACILLAFLLLAAGAAASLRKGARRTQP